jgi:chromosome segregation ATPase
MESLLAFAAELERRDAEVAQALDRVERLQRDVEQLRARAAATVRSLDSHAKLLAAGTDEERSALAARARAEAAVREEEATLEAKRGESERLETERALQDARDYLQSTERWVAESRTAREELERRGEAHRADVARLERRAVDLAADVRVDRPAADGLDGALEWASRARGALLLERSSLAAERETIVREASELVGSVLGEPLTATSVAGLRDRLSRALRETSA